MNGPRKESFANKVRTAISELAAMGKELTTDNISHQVFIQSREDHKKMLNVLCDLCKAGELVRKSRGIYETVRVIKPVEKRQIMWRFLRMERYVTVDDLVEVADVSRKYAEEWLQTLTKQQVVRSNGVGGWRLIKNTVEMPEMSANADKLRALREKKKQALTAALDSISMGMDRAREALKDL